MTGRARMRTGRKLHLRLVARPANVRVFASNPDSNPYDYHTHKVQISEFFEARRQDDIPETDDLVVSQVSQDVHLPVDAFRIDLNDRSGTLRTPSWRDRYGGGEASR